MSHTTSDVQYLDDSNPVVQALAYLVKAFACLRDAISCSFECSPQLQCAKDTVEYAKTRIEQELSLDPQYWTKKTSSPSPLRLHENQITPGTWTYTERDDGIFEIISYDASGHPIGPVVQTLQYGVTPRLPDIKLMEAAPELLDVLQAIVACYYLNSSATEFVEQLKEDDLIKKAEQLLLYSIGISKEKLPWTCKRDSLPQEQ